METSPRKAYPTDVSDEEWEFVAPYLTLMDRDAPQRRHVLREVFNGLRFIVRSGLQWRLMPHDLPPWRVGAGQPSGGASRIATSLTERLITLTMRHLRSDNIASGDEEERHDGSNRERGHQFDCCSGCRRP